MDWNDTVTILILADTVLNAKLLVAGYFAWRWWQRRKVRNIGIAQADVFYRIQGSDAATGWTNNDLSGVTIDWEGKAGSD